MKRYKSKKAIPVKGKLFIGLTTKPRYELQIRSKTTQLILDALWAKKVFISENLYPNLAVWTGLEPATPCVTGMYSNQLNYQTSLYCGCKYTIVFCFCNFFYKKIN